MCSSAACNAQEVITTADLRGQICECLWHFAGIDAEYLSVWRHEAELGRCFLFPVYFRAKLCSRDRFSVRLVGKIRRLVNFSQIPGHFFTEEGVYEHQSAVQQPGLSSPDSTYVHVSCK